MSAIKHNIFVGMKNENWGQSLVIWNIDFSFWLCTGAEEKSG